MPDQRKSTTQIILIDRFGGTMEVILSKAEGAVHFRGGRGGGGVRLQLIT